MREVPAWRVAWFHPQRGRWVLGLYEYTCEADAQEQASWYRADAVGVKAEVLPCRTLITEHGVNA